MVKIEKLERSENRTEKFKIEKKMKINFVAKIIPEITKMKKLFVAKIIPKVTNLRKKFFAERSRIVAIFSVSPKNGQKRHIPILSNDWFVNFTLLTNIVSTIKIRTYLKKPSDVEYSYTTGM